MLYLQTLGELTLTAPSGEVLSTRRKELVLLAYLARSAPRAVPRAELAELLWGERVEERARHSLRQALLQLRRVVGEGLRVGNEQVLLASGTLEVDVIAFEAEIAAGRLREAVARWRGDFLAGAEDLGGEVYRGWVEAEREAVRRLLAWALEQLVAEQERAERWEEAVGWAERWVEVLPFDEHPHLRLLEALRRDGRAGEALARHAGFAARLRRELELEPSAELLDFVEELERGVRRELAQLPSPAPAAPSVPEPVGQEEIPAASVGSDARVASVPIEERRLTEAPLPRRRRSRWRWTAAVALVALGAAVLWQLREGPEAAPIIAVGVIQDYSGADTTGLAGALPEMLATNLARVPGLRVVSNARVHELLSLLDGAPESGALTRAARQAGASELVEGEIYRRPEGGLRLDLRRVELRSGAVRAAYSVEADNAFALVDRATAQFGSTGAGRADTLRLADATTSSLVAFRFYTEGLRAYYQGDAHSAHRLFRAALVEDSTFAMAAYYSWLSLESLGLATTHRELVRAVRLADRATDRERLLIRTAWADLMDEPARLPLAETLAIRYPTEPDGEYLLGRARLWGGDFLGALPHLRRVVAMDSLSLRGVQPRCRACDALAEAVFAYSMADSFPAAERTAREWTRLQPGSARSWSALARVLEFQDRYGEALAARRTASPLQPGNRIDPIYPSLIAIRRGDFAAADALLRERARDGPPDVQLEALWFLTISLRYQGRLREALATARRLRSLYPEDQAATRIPPDAVIEAQVLFELGRGREAAALFDSLTAFPTEGSAPARIARHHAWMLTHAATALAAAGDTAALPRLADSIQALGRRSAFGRDRRLHHHVRGLLLSARGQPEEAVAEFRRAIFSSSGGGYTRSSFELGRLLVDLGRPREAIAVLQPAVRSTPPTSTSPAPSCTSCSDAPSRPPASPTAPPRITSA